MKMVQKPRIKVRQSSRFCFVVYKVPERPVAVIPIQQLLKIWHTFEDNEKRAFFWEKGEKTGEDDY